MRAPRYRFPEEVRATTRAVASRMVDEGSLVHTAEEFETWISQAPAVRESLERGGYGTEFGPHDLFPLLAVFIEQAGGHVARAEDPPRTANPHVRVALIVGILLVVAASVAILVVR